jgi:peptide/nickel transport system ATP-binding protein
MTRNPADGPLLSVEGLRVAFDTADGRVPVVRGIGFSLHRGEALGIVGESGSGKTLTAQSILRMIPPPGHITGGKVLFDGADLLALPEKQLRSLRGRSLGMVFQNPLTSLNPLMRVGAQIAEALTVHGADRKQSEAQAIELLRTVGIPRPESRVRSYPHEFSGGMRQRAVIAMALANRPAVIVADEPTTALDVTIQAQILGLLGQLRRELGLALILISHDIGIIAEHCDRVQVMYAGQIVESGPVEEVLHAPEHPYTRALLRSLPQTPAAVRQRLGHIPGQPPNLAAMPPGCSFAARCEFRVDRCAHDEPRLEPVGGKDGRRAACWVTQSGTTLDDAARTAQAAPPAAVPIVLARADGVPAAGQGDTVLEVGNLHTQFRAGPGDLLGRGKKIIHAVDGVSLSIGRGESLGLVGESGCGKSTLARTIVRVEKAASGSVKLLGREILGLEGDELRKLRRHVQMIFQDPYASLDPRMTMGDVIAEPLRAQRVVERKAIPGRVASLLDMVGLNPAFASRYAHQLSGGQRQRAGIARALAARPELLVCDEPIASLDVSIQAQIVNLLADLQSELGLSYLFISHDLPMVARLCNRIAVMYLGQIVETGRAGDVLQSPQHPYTASLLSAAPSLHQGERRERIILGGDQPDAANIPSGCRFHTRCPVGPLARPERSICRSEPPPLQPTASGQQAACHFAGELTGGAATRVSAPAPATSTPTPKGIHD